MKQRAVMLGTELEDTINRAIATVTELLELLEAERCALKTRDAQALTRLSETKQARIQALEEIEMSRRSALKSNGYQTDRLGMQQCLNELGHRRLNQGWKSLVELLDLLQKQNRINGSVANLTYRFVERSLHILQGVKAEDSLYESTGQKSADIRSRSIAKI